MKPVRTVEVQVIELDAVEDAARRERVQGAFLGFNVGVTVMLFGFGGADEHHRELRRGDGRPAR